MTAPALEPRPVRTFRTSKGEEIRSALSTAEVMTALRAIAATGDRFARDLVAGMERYGSWTRGQEPWAHKLAIEADRRIAARAREMRPAPAPDAPAAGELGELFGIEIEAPAAPEPPAPSFIGIAAFMGEVRGRLKYPKIRLSGPGGEPLVIGICGPQSRRPGTFRVTDGRPFGSSRYYGWIGLDGSWHPSMDCPDWVAPALEAFGEDPAGAAAVHGKRTGHCSFCGLELTDARSVSVGYGPICAERYGLPWG
ncbi:MAG TPA: DUF6011 domain-containing protein [Candidatus Methylomirabilis sp.]|nr:DUF6011 domain-containing protein [Candidatus Methylomirabilis sp.]